MTTLIKNGTIITATDTYKADVLVKNGIISEIGREISKIASEIIDATDSTSSTGSIVGNRDVKITFDDGTTTTLSTLLGSSLSVLKSLVASLEDIYFATDIVNYIAWNIHQNKLL